jgi:hypothetical protein
LYLSVFEQPANRVFFSTVLVEPTGEDFNPFDVLTEDCREPGRVDILGGRGRASPVLDTGVRENSKVSKKKLPLY